MTANNFRRLGPSAILAAALALFAVCRTAHADINWMGSDSDGRSAQFQLKDAVDFTFTGVDDSFDPSTISNVRFQYGTPEPCSMALLGLGALG